MKDETRKKIGNKTYYFNEYTKALITNDVYTEGYDGKYVVWIDVNGNLDTTNGWKKTSYGAWYYQENGKLVRGEKIINGHQYRFSEYSGQMMHGFSNDSEGYIFTDKDGNITKLNSGWYRLNAYGNTNWYYFVNGEPANGWLNGYYFTYDGSMCDSIIWEDSEMFAFDRNGHLRKNQWFLEYGNWYYAGSTGRVYTGERKIGNKTYWFNDDGVWVK